jgi:pimeloyl-ACP methyl ester carboxylesterase
MAFLERADGAKIWWEAVGPVDRQPVVLIMGLGYPAAMWWRQLPALTSAHRVILVDNRGAGHTGDVVGAPYSIETMAADVAAVIEAAGETRIHLAGLSMGGMIAQELALSRPDLVQSLVLMATHPGVRHATFEPAALAMLRRRGNVSAREAAELAVPFNYADTTPRAAIEADWDVRMPLASSPAGYIAQLRGGATWSSLDRLPALEPPVLVLHGADDRLVPPVNGKRIADAVRGAVHIEIPHANHLVTTDQTDEVNGFLLAWFNKFA